ncbi:MAG: FAD-dependent oxidoreductase [Chloroflexi bacterium]|nr:FAD-dependent oxidoreductase [Chloroflexota bacterium]
MVKPVMVAVDDDVQVLQSVGRDLRRKYGQEYRVVTADSGKSALEALRGLKLRDEPAALFLVDQRMPEMTGVEFLAAALEIYPDAKRVLLTAYADTNAAIQAINEVKLDHYLLKPWDPPEENLYPVLQDLLDDWQANFRPAFEGVRVLGYPLSPHVHEIKDFLARNLVPYRSLDVETDPEAPRLLETIRASTTPTAAELPIVFFLDGSHLVRPTIAQVAEKVGLRVKANKPFYELIVVGAGPAGLSASVYGASEGLKTLMIESEAPGGQAGMSARIENYLGFPAGLSGSDLTRRAIAQATRFGVEILTPQIATGVRVETGYRFVKLADDSEVSCHALLIATGVSYRRLDIPGLEQLTGAGVYYGSANTEAMACRDKDVFIVGGGNSAGQAAMYLARFARSVTILIRAVSLVESMSQYLIGQIRDTKNIRVQNHSVVTEARGSNCLEIITITNKQTGEQQTVPAAALFIYIGAQPRTDWLGTLVKRDEQGFIYTGAEVQHAPDFAQFWKVDRDPFLLETSVPGIFAAGDVRHGSTKRIAFGVGDGAMAVQFVHQYLSSL